MLVAGKDVYMTVCLEIWLTLNEIQRKRILGGWLGGCMGRLHQLRRPTYILKVESSYGMS